MALPTGHELLPHFSQLISQIVGKPDDSFRSKAFQLERLPYLLGGAAFAIEQLALAQAEAVSNVSREVLSSARLTISGGARDRIGFSLDAFLEAARRTQNGLIACLGLALDRKLPASMSDLMKKGPEKWSVPSVISGLLRGYWHQHGRRLKDYRDLSQHHVVVISECMVFLGKDGQVRLRLLLPKNPERKRGMDLDYEEPAVHVFPYVWDELSALVCVCFRVTKRLVAPTNGPVAAGFFGCFKTPIVLGQAVSGHVPLSCSELENNVKSLLASLEKEVCDPRAAPP